MRNRSDGSGQTDTFGAQLARGLDNVRPVLQKSALLVNQTLDHAANFLFAAQVPQVAGNEVFRTDDRLPDSLAVLLAAGLVVVR